jgi:NAD(P)-dependent dehydrogenase (short-subunit alcohol dehydrogenase family)
MCVVTLSLVVVTIFTTISDALDRPKYPVRPCVWLPHRTGCRALRDVICQDMQNTIMRKAAVFGASGGVGRALVAGLERRGGWAEIHGGGRSAPTGFGPAVRPFAFDLLDESSIEAACQGFGGRPDLDLVVVATGLLQDRGFEVVPERTVRAVDGAAMARVLAVNTIGPTLIFKHILPLLPRDRRVVVTALSARVGSIGDNRAGGWHSYRASKAALNMVIANLAIELARTHPLAVVAGLHPGTVDTELSAPFQRHLQEGQLISAERSATCLLDVIDRLTPADSGGCFGWDGKSIPA